MTESNANIARYLPAMAGEDPRRPAVIVPAQRGTYRQLTYGELNDESDVLARGLSRMGIGPGVRVVLLVRPGLEFFALVFALFKVGAVMVCIDPGIGRRQLGRCLTESAPAALIGIPLVHWAQRLCGWGRKTLESRIVVSRRPWTTPGAMSLDAVRREGRRSPAPILAASRSGDVAAILFTSGSTGPPKGAIYTHGNFGAQVEALREAYGIEHGEVDVCTFPLFALFAPALGMTAVVPEMDFTRPARVDPTNIQRVIDDHQATNLFGSPALLWRLAEWGVPRGVKFASLRRVISAAPVPAAMLAELVRLLPDGAEVHTPYGATEALPVATIASGEVLANTRAQTDAGRGVCVGRAVGEIRVRVIRISDEPIANWSDDLELPPGSIGEIVVRGPVVTAEYFARDAETRSAKIADPGGGFYHRMGDLGYFDEQGRLWFCGRKSQRVKSPGGDMFTIPCEAVFNPHPGVRRSALVGVDRDGAVEPVLCVELTPSAARGDRAAIRKELAAIAAAHDHTRAISRFLFHPAFPVDTRHNAKIGREQLAAWAKRKLG